MSREKSFAKNTLILSIGTFLPKLASFVTLPILTGCLTKAEYGSYDLIAVLASLLLPAATLEIQAAVFRELIDVREDEDKIRTVVSNAVLFLVPVSIITLIILFFCLIGQPILLRTLICLYFFADILVNCARQIARGLQKNIQYSVSAIVSAMGKLVFTVICVYWLRAGLAGTIIALFCASFASLIYLLFRLKIYRFIRPGCFDKAVLKSMILYSWPLVPNGMSSWIMRVSDRFVVTLIMGISANAVYAVANRLPSILNLAQKTFTLAWQEHASVVSKDQDAGEYYSHMFKVLFNLMAGFFCLLIPVTPLLFRILIRGDYDEAYNQIPILFVATFFYSMTTFFGGIYVAYKKSGSVGITTIAAAICNLVVDLALIRRIGLYAASGSTLVSYIFLLVFRMIDVQKFVSIKYDRKHIFVVLGFMTLECFLFVQRNAIAYSLNLLIGVILFLKLNNRLVKLLLRKMKSMVIKKK